MTHRHTHWIIIEGAIVRKFVAAEIRRWKLHLVGTGWKSMTGYRGEKRIFLTCIAMLGNRREVDLEGRTLPLETRIKLLEWRASKSYLDKGDDWVELDIGDWIGRSIESSLLPLDVTNVPNHQRIESPPSIVHLTRSDPLSFDGCIEPIISLSLPLLLSLALLLFAEEEFAPPEPLPLSVNCFSNSSTCIEGGRLVFNGRLRKWSVRRWRPPGGGLCVCMFEPPGRRFRRLFPRIGALHGVRLLKALVVMIDVSTLTMGSTGRGRFFDDDLEEKDLRAGEGDNDGIAYLRFFRMRSITSLLYSSKKLKVPQYFPIKSSRSHRTCESKQIINFTEHFSRSYFIVDLVPVGRRFILSVIDVIQ